MTFGESFEVIPESNRCKLEKSKKNCYKHRRKHKPNRKRFLFRSIIFCVQSCLRKSLFIKLHRKLTDFG